jgi:hypothetical protein
VAHRVPSASESPEKRPHTWRIDACFVCLRAQRAPRVSARVIDLTRHARAAAAIASCLSGRLSLGSDVLRFLATVRELNHQRRDATAGRLGARA